MASLALIVSFLLLNPLPSDGLFSTRCIPLKHKIASQTVCMMSSDVAVATRKHSGLKSIKERYTGRLDIGVTTLSTEDEEDVQAYSDFALADDEEIDPPSRGQILTGKIVEIDDNGALVEIGGKMSGYLPLKEAALIPPRNLNSIFQVGQDITGEIIGTFKKMPVISLRSSQLQAAWEQALAFKAADTTFEVTVLEVNRGGAICAAFGLKAFLPGSHYLGTPDASLIGTTLKVKLLDADDDEGKLVVSQRRAMTETLTNDFKKGQVLTGTVTGLRPYGAFLELENGAAGLLHISQISYDRVDNLESLFTVGQKCKVMILEHDRANGRVALSTKTLEPNPGDMLRNMATVFEQAEATAKIYQERLESERLTREATAIEIVAGLGGAIDDATVDPLVSVADSIESILASITSSGPNQA